MEEIIELLKTKGVKKVFYGIVGVIIAIIAYNIIVGYNSAT